MTPEYASPEQIRGEPDHHGDRRLLAGRRALRAAHRPPALPRHEAAADEILEAVLERAPREAEHGREPRRRDEGAAGSSVRGEPQKLRRRLIGDLDTIVLKALRKEPHRRYASAEQLSEDIRRHLEGCPVVARPDAIAYRAGKFVRRHKAGVAAAALVFLSARRGGSCRPPGRPASRAASTTAPNAASRTSASSRARSSSSFRTRSPTSRVPLRPASSS